MDTNEEKDNIHAIRWEVYKKYKEELINRDFKVAVMHKKVGKLATGGPQPAEIMEEVCAYDSGVDQGGCGCLDLGPYLLGGGSVGHDLQVGDVVNDTKHWEGFGKISPQGGPQADGEATLERTGQNMGLYLSGGSNDRGIILGVGH